MFLLQGLQEQGWSQNGDHRRNESDRRVRKNNFINRWLESKKDRVVEYIYHVKASFSQLISGETWQPQKNQIIMET